MAEITDNAAGILRKKVAGVPVLYLAGAGVLGLAVVAYRMRDTTAENDGAAEELVGLEDGDTDTGAPLLAGTGDPSGYDAFVANGSITQDPADKADPVDAPDPTNDEWVRKGSDWLATQGISGGAAQLALAKYVEGEQLSHTEGQWRDKVIRQFGTPPEYVKPGGTAGAPAPAGQRQGNPPCNHTIKGSNDNTLAKLSNLYYGRSTDDMLDLFQINNPRLPVSSPSQALRVGTVVKVPKYNSPKYYVSTKTTNTASEIAKKNGTSSANLAMLNDGMKFPVKAGTRVRVA